MFNNLICDGDDDDEFEILEILNELIIELTSLHNIYKNICEYNESDIIILKRFTRDSLRRDLGEYVRYKKQIETHGIKRLRDNLCTGRPESSTAKKRQKPKASGGSQLPLFKD
jgi:hypothetical protein